MQHMKRWLAAVLAVTLTLSDCGAMTVLATENDDTSISSVSENNAVSDETPSDQTDATEVGSEISEEYEDSVSEIELPALHIGQIKEGEGLPSPTDSAFLYDIPVSFGAADHLVLFANYSIDTALETGKGTLAWSILRGEKGLNPGSPALLNEEDDWIGFETVSASPFFVMEEITDEESQYYHMIVLAPAETSSAVDTIASNETEEPPENYDYYIRAAYYPETDNGKAESFYAASTLPFVPQKAADTEQNPEDTSVIDEIPADAVTDEIGSENSADTVDGEISENLEDSPDDAAAADESDAENTLEDTDEGSAESDQTTEDISTLSENNNSIQPKADEQPPLEEESDSILILYKGTEIDWTNILEDKERLTMSPGDTQLITAAIMPETTQADILWESSDETVAAVTTNEDGTATIEAFAEGYARITASYRNITASVIVDVVLDKANLGNDKLLDLSGDIRVAGFEKESDDLIYNGQKITQSLRVYHKNTLLKEKTDYTLSYKNNVNAAAWNSAKAPSVTINLKGQYQGSVTLYYTIKPLDINNIDSNNTAGNSPGYEQTVNYSANLNIPAPVLTFGKKKLAVNKDFVCDYSTPGEGMTPLPADIKNGNLYDPKTVYSYTVRGTGNFTGSFLMQLVVLNNKSLNFGSASVKFEKKQYEYHGVPLTKSEVTIEEVKLGGQILNKAHYDYEVYATGMADAYIMLSPTPEGREAGYRGSKKVTLKLVGDRQLKDAVPGADWKESIPFSQKTVDKDGGIFQKGAALLAYSEAGERKPLSAGTDYTVKYSNAKKSGKVTVTFTGKGRYQGSLRLTYTITPNTDIKIFPGKNVVNKSGKYEVAYQKDGAVPELILKDQDYSVLKNKTDYTIKYKDNKTPGTPMTCEITGKGNYKGYQKTVTLTVTKADIGKTSLSIPDKPYSIKPNKWQSSVTITDVNGKKLAVGKDYTLSYEYKQEQSPPAGSTVTVTVNGQNCYENSITGTYRIFEKNISTLKVVIDPQEYTGEEIKLNQNYKRDIHIYANNTDAKKKQNEIKEDCYEIVGYTNNIKAGTAKVTLHGTGNYGGTKTYSFKIDKKKYRINHVKEIKLNKTSLSFSLAEEDTEKRTLTATLTSEMWQTIANPTVIWSTSDSSIVAIEEPPIIAESIVDGKAAVTSSVRLTLKKEGSVTITAIAQDGNKKAQCKISVIDAPLLKEAGETIKEEIGKTYLLHMEFTESQDPSKVSWESNNPSAISVDKSGLLTMNKAGAAIIKAVYSSGNRSFAQECYAVAIDPNEKMPEGNVLTYEQDPGTTDDTPYINKLLRDWEWGYPDRYEYLYLPAGVYHIDAVGGGKDALGNNRFGGIILTDNQKLIMSPSALLVAIGNNQANSHIIWAFGRDNITISGGQIIGERKIHTGSGGEWGHGIQISGCTNVTIENVEISQCWGDGIYLGFYDGPNKYSNDVTITNCNLHHNRRNNLSITDASNVTIRNCQFNNASGTAPQYGIDIEPNKNRTCSNVTISDSTFKGNAGGTIQILGQLNAHVKGVTIENCNGDKEPVIWQGFGGSVSGVTQKNNKW
ncbi:MAG: right-handed parallel beta-helix repeat-containing protein [Lachnospiraceae bacterium]|nr:right-handed parallel beta-helix repeat-containing protein [Lachnospiraceae bacterium]